MNSTNFANENEKELDHEWHKLNEKELKKTFVLFGSFDYIRDLIGNPNIFNTFGSKVN